MRLAVWLCVAALVFVSATCLLMYDGTNQKDLAFGGAMVFFALVASITVSVILFKCQHDEHIILDEMIPSAAEKGLIRGAKMTGVDVEGLFSCTHIVFTKCSKCHTIQKYVTRSMR